MKSVWGESRARIALCPRCKAETLPRRLRSSSLARNALRGSAEGMDQRDAKAERVRAKKARKAEKATLRAMVRDDGIITAAKFFLSGRAEPAQSEDCQDCLAIQRRRSAA